MPRAVTGTPTASAHASDDEPNSAIGDVHKFINFFCISA
jgi:hypothetical protein